MGKLKSPSTMWVLVIMVAVVSSAVLFISTVWIQQGDEAVSRKVHLEERSRSYYSIITENIKKLPQQPRKLIQYINQLAAPPPLDNRPHIIFILMDDMGFNDAGFQGAEFPTKHIDALAYSGVRLSNYYVHYVCSPTRAALMTGRVSGAENEVYQPVFFRSTGDGLPPTAKVISEEFQDIGYSTHMIGKWHLGYPSIDHTPLHRGFDTFFGILGPRVNYYEYNDMCPIMDHMPFMCNGKDWNKDKSVGNVNHPIHNWGYDLWDGDMHVADQYDHIYTTDLWTQKAVDLITNHAEEGLKDPMFILLAYTAPHDPWQAPYQYIESDACRHIERFGRRILCAMLQSADAGIGRVMDALKEVGYDDNTNIIFSSDNGASIERKFILHQTDPHGSNFPLRGGKATYYDGGQKVIGWVWGDQIRPGAASDYKRILKSDKAPTTGLIKDGLIFVTDWYLTMLAMAGQNVTDSRDTLQTPPSGIKLKSGYNMLDYLTEEIEECPREFLYYGVEKRANKGAIRNKHYKLGYGMSGAIGWSDPKNMTRFNCTKIFGKKKCEPAVKSTFFFKISEDIEEMHVLNVSNLDEEANKNYTQLKEQYDAWFKIKGPKTQPIVGNSSLRDAQMVPRLWNCRWMPFVSTEKHPIDIEDSCEDESRTLKVTDLTCPSPWTDKWQQFAVKGTELDPKYELQQNSDAPSNCVVKIYSSEDLNGTFHEISVSLGEEKLFRTPDLKKNGVVGFRSIEVGSHCKITISNGVGNSDGIMEEGRYVPFVLSGLIRAYRPTIVTDLKLEGVS